MNALTFRAYRPEDRAACLTLFDANCPEFFAPSERSAYLGFLEDGPDDYSLASIGTDCVGVAGLSARPGSDLGIDWIMTAPNHRGAGIGAKLLNRMIDKAAEQGAPRLHIATSHLAEDFFKRFGAVRVTYTADGWDQGMHRVDMVIAL